MTQELQGKFSKWKASMMNQYLLNEEVHIYDFANGEPMLCDIMNGVPCCRPRDDFKGRKVPEDVKQWKSMWRDKKKRKQIDCPETFGLEHEGKNACLLFEYDATCDGKFFTALMKPLTDSF